MRNTEGVEICIQAHKSKNQFLYTQAPTKTMRSYPSKVEVKSYSNKTGRIRYMRALTNLMKIKMRTVFLLPQFKTICRYWVGDKLEYLELNRIVETSMGATVIIITVDKIRIDEEKIIDLWKE